MRATLLLGTFLLALLSLILAMPLASIVNHLLGFEGYSLGRQLALNLAFGLVVLVVLGVPAAAAARKRASRAAARAAALPAQATVVNVKDTPTTSKRRGVRLTLDVALPNGGHKRVVSDTWLVHKADYARLQPGTVLDVMLDPTRAEHVFPNRDWLAEQ